MVEGVSLLRVRLVGFPLQGGYLRGEELESRAFHFHLDNSKLRGGQVVSKYPSIMSKNYSDRHHHDKNDINSPLNQHQSTPTYRWLIAVPRSTFPGELIFSGLFWPR